MSTFKKSTGMTRPVTLTAGLRVLLGVLPAVGMFSTFALPAHAGETNEVKTAEPLTPEQMFEGGAETYPNWVEFSVGGLMTSGSKAAAEARQGMRAGAFGGIEDFHYQKDIAKDTTFKMDGRALFDQDDYKLSLGVVRPDRGFVKFNFEQYRTWYNGNGGYYAPADLGFPMGGDALGVDRGKITFEAGLTLENKPQVTFKYSHLYREGDKSSTSWGPTHPEFNLPAGDLTLVRGLAPAFYDIDETRDIVDLNVKHHIKNTDVKVGFSYEHGDLNNARKISTYPGEPAARDITDREGTKYDMVGTHASTETWIKKNLFFSTGFLFSDMCGDLTGSRIYGTDFDVPYTPTSTLSYYNLNGIMHQQDYVMNVNLMSLPTKHLVITPSLRVEKQDWDSSSLGVQTGTTQTPLASQSYGDQLDVTEQLDARYTGITNWVFYARGEWTQGDGSLNETNQYNGLPPAGAVAAFNRATDDGRFFQKYTAGARWYPLRWLTVDAGGYYKNHDYDYNHTVDSTANGTGSANRYPAYLVMQNFETYDANLRLTARLTKSITVMGRYEYQLSNIHTRPDNLSEVDSSDMTSHIFAVNATWVPWSRLYLQAGANYAMSTTETPASAVTQAILDARNNYLNLNCNAGLVVDDKTDLNVGYFYYLADNYQNNSAAGLPYGSGAEEHGVTATLTRRLSAKMRVKLRYGYFHSADDLYGGMNDYDAHLVYATLQYRF